MSDRNDKTTADRRSFLKLAGIGTLTGGAAMAIGGSPVKAAAELARDDSSYRESEHVKTYYELARF